MMRYLVCAMMLSCGSAAYAQDPIDVMYVQAQLEAHGFDVGGKPDGRIGPKTKSALAGYGDRYGVSSDFTSVLSEMMRRNFVSRVQIVDEQILTGIKERVGEDLNDPFSAEFRNFYEIGRPNGSSFICGEVNAKNLFGAYVGFRFFYGLESSFSPIMLLRVDDENSIAEKFCTLSHPR